MEICNFVKSLQASVVAVLLVSKFWHSNEHILYFIILYILLFFISSQLFVEVIITDSLYFYAFQSVQSPEVSCLF